MKPNMKRIIKECILPIGDIVYCGIDKDGFYVRTEQNYIDKHYLVDSSEYKSPTWAFEQCCKNLDLKIRGLL